MTDVSSLVRRLVIAAPVGVVGGLLSAGFLRALEWTERTRSANDRLVWFLPLAGFAVGLAYWKAGSSVAGGNAMLFDRVENGDRDVPFRLAPLVFCASVVSHVAGASVGREGAALQMTSGAVGGWGSRLGLNARERSLLLVSSIAAGFGSIVGAPVAGAVFALEVRRGSNPRLPAALPALVASAAGVGTVALLGIARTPFPEFPSVDPGVELFGRLALASVVCGVSGLAFVAGIDRVRTTLARMIAWPPLRPAVGGFIVMALVVLLDLRDVQGLSLHLAVDAQTPGTALADGDLGTIVRQWWSKFLLTVVSVGSGFIGGEVVPLIVLGALTGAAVGRFTGGDAVLLAIIGSIAMLAGGAKAPIACAILGAELFGWSGLGFFLVACLIARLASGRNSIYGRSITRSS